MPGSLRFVLDDEFGGFASFAREVVERALRDGDWKLVHGQAGDDPPELFDLAKDVSENNSLASAQPEKVKELKSLWDAWNAQQAPPDAAKDKSLKQKKRKAKKAAPGAAGGKRKKAE